MQKPLKMIGSSAERVLELVTNLMDYWNLADDPNQDVPQDPIDFPTLINESMARCEQAKDKRGRPMKKDKVHDSAGQGRVPDSPKHGTEHVGRIRRKEVQNWSPVAPRTDIQERGSSNRLWAKPNAGTRRNCQ